MNNSSSQFVTRPHYLATALPGKVFPQSIDHRCRVRFPLCLQDHSGELQLLQHAGALTSCRAELEFAAILIEQRLLVAFDLALPKIQQRAAQGRIRPHDALPEAQACFLVLLNHFFDVRKVSQRLLAIRSGEFHIAETAAGEPVQGMIGFVRDLCLFQRLAITVLCIAQRLVARRVIITQRNGAALVVAAEQGVAFGGWRQLEQ